MSLSPTVTVKDLFLESCGSNDVNKVRLLHTLGANVNWKDSKGGSGLHIAARYNYGELLELLLSQPGVDVNITDIYNMTPLMWACVHGHSNIVRRLCQVNGIETNIRSDSGCTALYYAVLCNTPRCVEILKTVAGVDWNVRSNDGNNPLIVAVDGGHADILQTLLSVSDLDLSVTDQRGRNVAQIAVEQERGERQRCVEILSRDRRVDWNIKNSTGDTPVMFCLKRNKIEMARCLINTPGVDLDLENIASDDNRLNVLNLLMTFSGPRLRILQRNSLLSRQSGTVSSLQILSSDAVLVSLITNNRQARKVESLVDRLGEDNTRRARDILLRVRNE